MAVVETIERLNVFTEPGTLIAELLNINASTKLSDLRSILEKKTEKYFGVNFTFSKKGTNFDEARIFSYAIPACTKRRRRKCKVLVHMMY